MLALWTGIVGHAAEETKADRPLGISGTYPKAVDRGEVDSKLFPELKVEGIAGKLKFSFESAGLEAGAAVRLWTSADEPGHWPARHWVAIPMKPAGRDRVAKLPIDALDIPVVYFVEALTAGVSRLSPLRICEPRELGLEKPSRPFWSFLDGFETGLAGWRSLSGEVSGAALETVEEPMNGRRSLRARIPDNKASISIGTTAVREWHARLMGASGVRFHARTVSGAGRIRLTALAHAFSGQQQVSEMRQTIRIGTEWKQIDVFFREFPGLNLKQIDLLAFEFIGEPEAEFLMDDLRLLGNWASD